MSQVWTTDALAQWTVGLDASDLPDAVIAKAEDCILDVIACAIAGRDNAATTRVAAVASSQYREGPADIWFGAEGLHPTGAAFINANAASILDLDDGHRLPCGHPGAAVVPAVLAVAQETGGGGMDLLAAVVAGYEVCTRIGGSENRIAYHTGNWTGFGVAAAAARQRGMAVETVSQALAITAYHGPRVADLTLSSDMGANVKESIPWSVVTGLNAVDLAAQGFTGCRDALDIDERFKPGRALDGLGQGFQITRTYFKRYSACRWVHAAVEALLQIVDVNGLAVADIQGVRVETFRQAASLNNLADPPSPESAQYSIPFCLGLAATRGDKALMPMAAADLHDPAAVAFAGKVDVVCDPDLVDHFPATVPSRVHVETSSGSYDAFIERPWGEPNGPTGRDDLISKFHALASGRITEDRAVAIIAAIEKLKEGPVGPLTVLLAGPMDTQFNTLREVSHG